MGQIIKSLLYPFEGEGYVRDPGRLIANQTYAQIFTGAGTTGNFGNPAVFLRGEDTNPYYERSMFIDIVVDLRAYSFVTFTSASITMQASNISMDETAWGTDLRNGIALVSQRETVRDHTVNAINYHEIYEGAVNGTEYASRIGQAACIAAGNVTGNVTFTLNAAGISYLNSVKSKANLTGFALFGVVFGGQADNVTPTYLGVNNIHMFYTRNVRYMTLNYTTGTTGMQINVGDAWKDATGGLINVGDEWKGIDDIDLNVGDAWKNKA